MTAPKTPQSVPGSAQPAAQGVPAHPQNTVAGQIVNPAPPPRVPGLPREQLLAACEAGLDLCRSGNLKEGLAALAALGDLTRVKDVPSAYFSYMGYALAKNRKQIQQGTKLCRHAIKLEFFQTENYVNLARTCLLSEKYRRDAWEAVRDGLRIDPEHPELLALQRELGSRKPPVIRFLGRNNPLNRLLGSVRYLLTREVGGKKTAEKPAGDKEPSERRARRQAQVVTLA